MPACTGIRLRIKCARQPLIHVRQQPAPRDPERRDGRHGVHHLEREFYGDISTDVTWRPATSIPLADTKINPDTVPDPEWRPLVNTPCHPEYPRASQPKRRGRHGFAQALRRPTGFHADDGTRVARTQHRASADGRQQRSGLGRHALPEHSRNQRRGGRSDCQRRQPKLHAAASRRAIRMHRALIASALLLWRLPGGGPAGSAHHLRAGLLTGSAKASAIFTATVDVSA